MANNNIMVKTGAIIIANRTHSTSPSYRVPDRFKVSINTTDPAFTDTELMTLVPIDGTETIDDCSAITGWSVSGGNVSANTITYKPDGGTIGALNLIKSTTLQAHVYAEKATPSKDGTDKDLLVWLYIKDTTVFNKLDSTTPIEIRIGSATLDYMFKTYAPSSLTVGWNFLSNSITPGFTGTIGTPSITAIDYTMIKVNTTSISYALQDDEIVIDSIRLASEDDYYKDVESIQVDEIDAAVTTISKLSVSEANGFLLDGQALFNKDSAEKMFTKSKFSRNSKEVTDLIKTTQKIKYRNINQ